jgi:hypothetical protein
MGKEDEKEDDDDDEEEDDDTAADKDAPSEEMLPTRTTLM